MKLKNIAQIENKLGYSFRDPALLTQAFTRTSFCNEKNYGGKENYSSNEVLEFFGDSVLSTAIVTLLMRKNTTHYAHGIRTSLTEGDFSNIRSKLSDKRNLSKRIAELGFQKFMLLGEGDEKLGINEEASVMEDLFESIIGAVYIDCGMDIETVISVVERMLDINEYANGEAPIQSYKNALQEWCADKKHRLPTPVYKTISEEGPDHKKTYERGVYLGDRLVGVGQGKNQKLADTAAAEAALSALKSESAKKVKSDKAPSADGAAKSLRELASAKKLPSPEYRDLGESPESTDLRPIYVIECRFAGISASAKGFSKQEARDLSSAALLSELKSKEDGAEQKKQKPAKAQKTSTQGTAPQKSAQPQKASPKSTAEKKGAPSKKSGANGNSARSNADHSKLQAPARKKQKKNSAPKGA